MKTLRCKSLQATGLLDVHVPLYGISAKDGDEFPVQDDAVAAALLGNPNFEEVVKPAPRPAFSADAVKDVK